MRTTYLVLALLIVLLGLVHLASTPQLFDELNSRALWFASGGLLLVMTGALNLLNRTYGAAAPGLRGTTVAANLVLTVFAVIAGLAGGASGVQLVGIIGLMAATTVWSLLPNSLSA